MSCCLHRVAGVRSVIAIPVSALMAGALAGLRWDTVPISTLAMCACAGVSVMVHAWRVRSEALTVACVAVAFGCGGAALAADASRRAWRPSLFEAFEQMVAGQAHAATRSTDADTVDQSARAWITGVLREDASLRERGTASLAVSVDTIATTPTFADARAVSGGVQLSIAGSLSTGLADQWRAGRRIRAPVDLRRPTRYRNDGVPDFERISAHRGVRLVGSVKSAALVEVLSRGSPVDEWAARIRGAGRRAIDEAVGRWGRRSAAIVKAIVIGDRSGLEADVERRLQEAGTYHVIAISGGNIAILAGLTLWFFRVAGLIGRTAMLTAAAALLAYGFVVVGGASVTRATLMAVVYFVGRGWDLRGPPLHTLILVAGLMVLADPLTVADVSSLLTFGATLGIMAVGTAGVDRWPGFLRPAAATIVASLAAEAVLLPVSAGVFERVTFAGLVLNLGAIPLMAVAQLAGMAAVALWFAWPPAAVAAGGLAHLGAEGLVRTADLVAFAPWVTWRVAAPHPLLVLVYYLTGAAAWLLRRPAAPAWWWAHTTRRLSTGFFVAAALAVLGAFQPRRATGDGTLQVTFLDVGQGDASLVQFPRGGTMLIDAGGLPGSATFDVGDRVVGPALRHRGIGSLDAVVLTHGDADHIGGAGTVIREFSPWDVWEGIPVPPSPALQLLHEEAGRVRARWTTVQSTDAVEIDGVRIVVRHPGVPDWERQDVRNDDSIVLELSWRDVSFVLTGDIGRAVEPQLASQFAPAPLRVVKVPHHGSPGSSSVPLVEALRPRVAVFSVGRGNRYGHPSRAVQARYRDAGAAIFRTDLDGAITVRTDGHSLRVETNAGQTLEVAPDDRSGADSPSTAASRHRDPPDSLR